MNSKYNMIPGNSLAKVAGQISSIHTAMGQIVQIRTREISNCLNTRASWHSPIKVGIEAKTELIFWLKNVEKMNGIAITRNEISYSLFTDASKTGFGGYIEEVEGFEVNGSWSEMESVKSSTWRELEAMRRAIFSFENDMDMMKGERVHLNTDNMNVVSIIKKGSRNNE